METLPYTGGVDNIKDNTKKSVTVKDVAREANVSFSTVSRYLNSSGYVDVKTGEKIDEVIKRLNYRPNRIAQSLKTKSSKNIVLIVPDIQNPFYSKMANQIQHLTLMEGYTVTLLDSEESYENEIKGIHLAQDMSADGIIFASVSKHKSILDELDRCNISSVLVNSYDSCQFDTIHGVREQSTYLTTRHLINLGHHKIGFAGGAIGTVIGNSRKNGYIKAMQEAGIPVREDYMFEMGFSSDAGRKCGYYFSALNELPTAICCANDMIALGVLQALSQQGIRVPDQISITGVDDIMYGDLCNPRLTTVTNDSNEFAHYAVKALIERMNGTYSGEARELLISHELIVRDSTKELKK